MEAINWVATVFLYISLASLFIGLAYKPWVVLWYLDQQNRLMVIQHYGGATIVFWILKIVTA